MKTLLILLNFLIVSESFSQNEPLVTFERVALTVQDKVVNTRISDNELVQLIGYLATKQDISPNSIRAVFGFTEAELDVKGVQNIVALWKTYNELYAQADLSGNTERAEQIKNEFKLKLENNKSFSELLLRREARYLISDLNDVCRRVATVYIDQCKSALFFTEIMNLNKNETKKLSTKDFDKAFEAKAMEIVRAAHKRNLEAQNSQSAERKSQKALYDCVLASAHKTDCGYGEVWQGLLTPIEGNKKKGATLPSLSTFPSPTGSHKNKW